MSNRKDLFKSVSCSTHIDGVKWQVVNNNIFAFVHPIFDYIENIDAEVTKVYNQLPELIEYRDLANQTCNLFIIDAFSHKVIVTDIIQ